LAAATLSNRHACDLPVASPGTVAAMAARMAYTDRAFRALAQERPDLVVALLRAAGVELVRGELEIVPKDVDDSQLVAPATPAADLELARPHLERAVRAEPWSEFGNCALMELQVTALPGVAETGWDLVLSSVKGSGAGR
jgi:hypothetical protein